MNINVGDNVTFTTTNARDPSDKKIYTKSGTITNILPQFKNKPNIIINVVARYYFVITKDDIVSINSNIKDKL